MKRKTYFSKSGSFDQVIQLPKRGISREALNVFKKVILFLFKQSTVFGIIQGFIPERTNINSDNFRCSDDLKVSEW